MGSRMPFLRSIQLREHLRRPSLHVYYAWRLWLIFVKYVTLLRALYLPTCGLWQHTRSFFSWTLTLVLDLRKYTKNREGAFNTSIFVTDLFPYSLLSLFDMM